MFKQEVIDRIENVMRLECVPSSLFIYYTEELLLRMISTLEDRYTNNVPDKPNNHDDQANQETKAS